MTVVWESPGSLKWGNDERWTLVARPDAQGLASVLWGVDRLVEADGRVELRMRLGVVEDVVVRQLLQSACARAQRV